jgi:hypothetical protein
VAASFIVGGNQSTCRKTLALFIDLCVMTNISDDQVDIETLPSQPYSIASLQDGSVYVACMNGSVQHVSSDCKSYKTVTTKGLTPMEEHVNIVISYNPKQRSGSNVTPFQLMHVEVNTR